MPWLSLWRVSAWHLWLPSAWHLSARMRSACLGLASMLAALMLTGKPAFAHDLAVDQLMLWPDRAARELRGELTLDPELTRDKDARPTEEHARRAVDFSGSNLEVTLDGRPAPLAFEVRELWVRGGATLGDVLRFSTRLDASVRELRVHARGFPALVVSVQRVSSAESAPGGAPPGGSAAPPRVETTSWLLGRDDATPVYHLDEGWREPGWRSGGPDVFVDSTGALSPVAEARGAAAAGDGVASDVSGGEVAGRALAAAAPQAGAAASGLDAEAGDASAAQLAARFVRLGFEHILPGGIDHVLFVAGLVLARARRYRQVLVSLSLFTLAHTLTLALGHFQLLQVPPEVVEPLIAFSIFALGIDNLRASRTVETPASLRHAVVFCFGLVHGLGFASALSELAFDGDHFVLALFSFNLGVELGQVGVVALLAVLLLSIRGFREIERYALVAGSAAIAAAGLFMAVERVAGSDPATSSSVTPELAPSRRSAVGLSARPSTPRLSASSPSSRPPLEPPATRARVEAGGTFHRRAPRAGEHHPYPRPRALNGV